MAGLFTWLRRTVESIGRRERRLIPDAETAQHQACEMASAEFQPLNWAKFVAVAPAVVDGHERVSGMRYREDTSISGWFIIGEGLPKPRPEEFMLVHPQHLITSRPDLVCYLGLPVGWRFFHTPAEWRADYDAELLADDKVDDPELA